MTSPYADKACHVTTDSRENVDMREDGNVTPGRDVTSAWPAGEGATDVCIERIVDNAKSG